MTLPYRSLPHRLRIGDVLPFQLVNRVGERLNDARDAMREQHFGFSVHAGEHQPPRTGMAVGAQLWIAPPVADRRDPAAWMRLEPQWSIGGWDDTCKWEINDPNDWAFEGFGRLVVGVGQSYIQSPKAFRVAIGATSPLYAFGTKIEQARGGLGAVIHFDTRYGSSVQTLESVLVLSY